MKHFLKFFLITSNERILCFYFQTEYKYCYDLTLHYVSHYLNKTTINYRYK